MFFLLPVPHDLHIVFPYIKNGFYTAMAVLALYVLWKELIKQKKEDNYARTTESLTELEPLNESNKEALLQINCGNTPSDFVTEVKDIISKAEYGTKLGLPGYCFAIKYRGKYTGILLIGKAIKALTYPVELTGEEYFLLFGFLIDTQYQNIGIGSAALNIAIDRVYSKYGSVPILAQCHKDNIKAIRFYEKNGFVNTGIMNKEGTDYFMILE